MQEEYKKTNTNDDTINAKNKTNTNNDTVDTKTIDAYAIQNKIKQTL